ncbi:hypothetical protein [Microseira sp. BLCC-F43]|jgi:hypothetical protein|uniref:hypothetical protein n=1 Tax=Microseira sp. BLCC-F43 TaxID=3153602 RepID=UPI0035BA979A
MFPFFWGSSCYDGEPMSRRSRLERKRKFLQWMRDDLETKLAGINAALTKIDEQLNQEDSQETAA